MSKCRELLEKYNKLVEADGAPKQALVSVISQFSRNPLTKPKNIKWKEAKLAMGKKLPYVTFEISNTKPIVDVEVSFVPELSKNGDWVINIFSNDRKTTYAIVGDMVKAKEGVEFNVKSLVNKLAQEIKDNYSNK